MQNTVLILSTLVVNARKEQGVVSIKSRFGNEYDRPDTIILKRRKKKKVTPDLVISFKNRTDLYMVEQGADYDIERWRLMAIYALNKHGNFYIVGPKDYKSHISRKIEDSKIRAKIICFS